MPEKSPVTNFFISISEIYLVIKKLMSIFASMTGFGATKPAIGLNKIRGPHKIKRTIPEKVNPIKHRSKHGIDSPISF